MVIEHFILKIILCDQQADEETSYNEYVPLALHLSDEYFINNASRLANNF